MQSNTSNYYKLTWLSEYRSEIYGFSALWILLFHGYLCGIDWPERIGPIGVFFKYGNLGVDIFLFLSGISLYFAFIKKPPILTFYKRRLIKVVPAAWLTFIPLWIHSAAAGEYSWQIFAERATLLRFWFRADKLVWFVSAIIVFYLIYPLLYRMIFSSSDTVRIIIKGIIAAAVSVLLILAVMKLFPDYYKNVEIGLARFPVFLIGCVFGKFVYEKRSFSPWFLIVSAVIFIIECTLLYNYVVRGYFIRFFYCLTAIPMTFILAWFFYLIRKARPVRKILRFFGSISLELYLAQLMWGRVYASNLLPLKYVSNSLKGYALLMALSILSAVLVSKLIELFTRLITSASSGRKHSA